MATIEAIDLEDDWIAGVAFDTDLRFAARRATWPALARFQSWPLLAFGREKWTSFGGSWGHSWGQAVNSE